jgi:hypothetical protein
MLKLRSTTGPLLSFVALSPATDEGVHLIQTNNENETGVRFLPEEHKPGSRTNCDDRAQ